MSNKRKLKNKTATKRNGRVTSKVRQTGPRPTRPSLQSGLYVPFTYQEVHLDINNYEALMDGRIKVLVGIGLVDGQLDSRPMPCFFELSFGLDDLGDDACWGMEPAEVKDAMLRKIEAFGVYSLATPVGSAGGAVLMTADEYLSDLEDAREFFVASARERSSNPLVSESFVHLVDLDISVEAAS